MIQKASCLNRIGGQRPFSPFRRVLSLGWYDGTTSGLAQCAGCSDVFKYDLVDWDADQERRVFVLSLIDPPVFDHVVDLLSVTEKPGWPFWNPKWQMGPPERKDRVRELVDDELSRADESKYLIASDRKLENVFAVRELNESLREKLPRQFDGLPVTNDFDSWMNYLDTSR